MRTKEEIAQVLSKRGISKALAASTWGDLVSAISSFSLDDKARLIKLIAEGRNKEVGMILNKALLSNSEQRSRDSVDILLANDSLNLTEIDSLL